MKKIIAGLGIVGMLAGSTYANKAKKPEEFCKYTKVDLDKVTSNPKKYDGKSIEVTGLISNVKHNTTYNNGTVWSSFTIGLTDGKELVVGQYSQAKDTSKKNQEWWRFNEHMEALESRLKFMKDKDQSVAIRGAYARGIIVTYEVVTSKKVYEINKRDGCKTNKK